MKGNEGLDKLFFELASESRLMILYELSLRNHKMNELARKLDLTVTDAFRQLQRMKDAKLVEKMADGTFAITQFGKLTISLSSSFEFIFKNKQYFLDHDVWQLPYQFVNRIGELSKGILKTEMAENMNLVEEMIKTSEDHVWVMAEQILTYHSLAGRQSALKGVKIRNLYPAHLFHSAPVQAQTDLNRDNMATMRKNVETLFLISTPMSILINEKEAVVALKLIGGKWDFVGFYGNDPLFLKWTNDVYLYYWEQGKKWISAN